MFIRRFELFKLFGIPIRIDLSWFIIVVFITWSLAIGAFPTVAPDLPPGTYWAMGFAGAMGLFLSVLLHELGHALVARERGMRMNGITLFIFGGVAEMQDEPPSATDEFLVAIGGPIVSIALIGVFAMLGAGATFAGLPASAAAVLWWLALVNGVLVVFNMIPAFPLDGGRVLRAALWHWKGSLRWSTRVASTIGSGFGMFLIVFGIFYGLTGNLFGGLWLFVIGLFLRGAANMSYQQVLIRRALEGEPVSRFMKTEPIAVPRDLTIDRLVSDYFYRHYHKMYPVVENGEALGCITMRDVKELHPNEWSTRTVADLARPCSPENTITADTDAMEAMSRMSRNEASRLMVLDEDGRLVGVIALKDLLRFLSLKIELDEAAGEGDPASTTTPRGLQPPPIHRMAEFEETRR